MRRVFLLAGLGLGATLLSALLLIVAALGTQSGGRLLWKLVEGRVAGLGVESFEGRLGGALSLRGLRLETPALQLRVGSLSLRWSPARLLAGEFLLEALEISEVSYTQLEAPDPAPPDSDEAFALPERVSLPLAIVVRDVRLESLAYRSAPDADPLRVDSAALEGSFIDSTLSIGTLAVSGPLFSVDARGRTQTEGEYALNLALDWIASLPDLPPLRGQLTADGQLSDLRFAQQVALEGGAALNLVGQADLLAPQPAFDLSGDWQALGWPLSGDTQVYSREGSLQLSGNIDDYRASISAALAATGYTDATLSFEGQGDRSAFTIRALDLRALEGQLSARGKLRWRPQLRGEISAEGSGLNPAVLAPDFPGSLNLALGATAGVSDGRVEARVDTLSIDGVLREQAVDLQLEGSVQDGRYDLATLHARAGQSSLRARGSIGESLDLQWSIDSPDLGDLLPGASGSLSGNGSSSGALALPAVRGELKGEGVAYAGYTIGQLALGADVDPARSAPSRLALELADVMLPGEIAIGSLELDGQGNRSDHAVDLRVDSSEGSLRLRLAGALEDKDWRGHLSAGEIRYADLEAWQLGEAQGLLLSADTIQLEEGCWRSGEALACLQGQRDTASTDAELRLSAFDLAYLKPLLAAPITLAGTVKATAQLRQPPATAAGISLAVDVEGGELRLDSPSEEPDQLLLGLKPSQLRVSSADGGLQATLSMPFSSGGGIDAQAQIDGGDAPLAERRLRGSAALELDELGFLSALSSEVRQASGSLDGRVDLSGSLAEPQARGEIELREGALELLSPGLTIGDLALRATSDDGQRITFEGSATSGGGTLLTQGVAEPGGEAFAASVTLNGEGFEVANTADVQAFLSPDLSIRIDDSGTHIEGEIRVPRATITPQELPRSVVAASADEVIIRADSDADDTVIGAAEKAVSARLRLVLGDEVNVDGFGFKGQLGGALTITQQPGQPALGSGEVSILKGEYRAYGQGLVIDRGRILFAGGPISQPGVNIRASRRPAAGIEVGVQVRGPLQAPDFTVYSDPAMTQAEQLSWLVLGRPLNGTSEGESSLIAQAAIALGLRGGNFLADRIGGNLGVDSIGFETGSGEAGAASDVNEAALVVGKYLSPGLFVSYGIGLFDAISTVRLEYSLDEHWKLSTESSTIGSGGDVTYTIER
ncbi:MAG: translocation/assembly module TamB domain-containing protein [Halieaceae bacterium]|jgi:translocation and assembly module TamB|nr:translocation/assembly module TamB domain-containing protein [Halieaceae bacterium]